jgi:uncharacterized membrane protein YidH (DUF202 family)
MSTPLVKGAYVEPLNSDEFNHAMDSHGYAAVRQALGQPGITGAQALQNLNYGVKLSEQSLVEMYSGRNLVLENRVDLDLRNAQGPLFLICPLEQTRNIGKRTMFRTRYKQTVLGQLATYGLVRHMNWTRSSTSFELNGFGIGFQFEMQSLLEPEGRDIFNYQVQMAATATILTAEVLIMAAIVGCHETAKALDRFFPQTAGSLMHLVSTWNDIAFGIHKFGNGIQRIVGNIKRARNLLKVPPAQAFLVPQTTAEQLALGNPEARDVSRAGEEAVRVRNRGASEYSSVSGMNFIEIPPETISDTGAGVYDPLAHAIEIGYFYESNNGSTMNHPPRTPYNTANQRSIAIFTMENNGNRKVVPAATMVQNDLAFDPASGHLNTPLLQQLAEDYETMCRTKQMALHTSVNGDPLVDPHIAFDEDRVPFVVRHWGDVDPAYLSEHFIKTLARINQQELQRCIGKQAISDIRAMLQILDDAARYSISQSDEEVSVVEAFGAAVAFYNKNHISREDRTDQGLTPGNSYGCDFLPPLVEKDGTWYIGTKLKAEDKDATAVVMFNNAGVRQQIASEFGNVSFYSTKGIPTENENVVGWEPYLAIAPNFPPGFSSGNHAAYIAFGINSGDPGIASWMAKSTECRNKFETVARGWRAFEQYYEAQRGVFSLSKEKNAENVLMNPNACPAYMRPNNNNENLQAKLAYFQQAFIGMRGPLAVGNVYQKQGVAAVGGGLTAAGLLGMLEVTRSGTAGREPTSLIQGSTATGRSTLSEVSLKENFAVRFNKKRTSQSDAAIASFEPTANFIQNVAQVPSLLPGVLDAMRSDDLREFSKIIGDAMNRSATSDQLPLPAGFVQEDDVLLRFFNTPIDAFAAEGSRKRNSRARSLVQVADEVNPEVAALFINRIWSMLLSHSNATLNVRNINVAASGASSDFSDQTSVGGSTREKQTIRGLQQYGEDIGERTMLGGRERGSVRPAGYIVTRLQISPRDGGGLFDNVSEARAYTSILRPCSFQNTARIIAPFEAHNTPQQVARMSNDGEASFADIISASIDYSAVRNASDLHKYARNLRTKGRAVDSYIDRSADSYGSSAMYSESMHGGADSQLLGPISFYVENNQQSSGVTMGKRNAPDRAQSTFGSKRTFGGAAVHTSAGLNGADYYSPSATDMFTKITQDASESTATGDLVLYGPMMINSTRWLTARLGAVGQILSDPLERAMAVTFLLTPIHRDLLMRMLQKNYVLPRSYLLFQPFIRLSVYAAYGVSYGIGTALYAFPNISLGTDANTLLCTARFSTKMGAAITAPDQVTPVPLFKLSDYINGATTAVVAPGTIFSEMSQNSWGNARQITYNPADYANRLGDLFIIGVGCDSQTFGEELPLGGYFRPSSVNSKWSEQTSANMLRQRYPSALYLNMLCGFDTIGHQQDGIPSADSNYHLLTDLIAPLSDSYAGRLCFQGPQNNYNEVTGDYTLIHSAGCGPLGALRPNCGEVIKGAVGMISHEETQRTITQPLSITR